MKITHARKVAEPSVRAHQAQKTPVDNPRVEKRSWIVSCLLCVLSLCVLLGLFSADLNVPFGYDGDALFFLPVVKGIAQGEWTWYNSRLGMPFGADSRDFPLYTTVDTAVIRLISFATGPNRPGLLVNIFWLLAVTATSGTMSWAARRLGAAMSVAIGLGVVYALQPYTFFRGIAHLNLVFYLVPLLAAATIEVASGRFAPAESPETTRFGIGAFLRPIPLYAWVACAAQGFSYAYNSFFACFLLAVAAALAVLRGRRWQAAIPAFVLGTVISAAMLINISPSLVYWSAHGRNSVMGYKDPAQAEQFGLKIRHLLTPVRTHRLGALRAIDQRVTAARFPNENENAGSRLGTLGSLGFLILLGWMLRSCVTGRVSRSLDAVMIGACAALTLAAVLLATVGGFGSLFNVFVAPDIRAYNRIVVFISAFSLITVALLLTRVRQWWISRGWRKAAFGALSFVIAAAAVADEADTSPLRLYGSREDNRQGMVEAWYDDARFMRHIEQLLPGQPMIFQLPATDFPIQPARGSMGYNDHARAYLHSTRFRWSSGAITGRQAAEWARVTGELPAPEMIRNLRVAGFSGLWVDLAGYDGNSSPEPALTATLRTQPVRGRGGRILFYPFPKGNVTLHDAQETTTVLNPIYVTFPTGFSAEEAYQDHRWRWSDRNATMRLQNTLDRIRTVVLSMKVETGYPELRHLTVEGSGIRETLMVGNQKKDFKRTLKLPPHGEQTLSFFCDCRRIVSSSDPRPMYFRILDVQVSE